MGKLIRTTIVVVMVAVTLTACAQQPAATTAPPTQAQPTPAQAKETPEAQAPSGEPIKVVPEKGEGEVYYLGMIGNNVWEVYAAQTFERHGQELGYTVKSINAENSADNQVNQLSSVMGLKPKAIFLKPVDSTLIADTAQKAVEAGVPVISFDGQITAGRISLNVDVGLVKYGRTAGEEILKYLKSKHGSERGKVLNLMGDVSVPYSPLMSQGFHEVLDQYPDITVIDKDTKGWEMTEAANIAADQLTVNPDIDAMFVHTDSRFPGVVSVLEEKGYEKGAIYLIGVDGDPSALDLIREPRPDPSGQRACPREV